MKLIFLYGRPATGKYTVGRELAALTGYELFHNHLVVDLVLCHHPFGSPGFIAERDRLWREHLSKAAAPLEAGLIFTFNPENTVPQTFIDWLFDDLGRHHAMLTSIELTASETIIEQRLDSAPRREFRKLSDRALYGQLRAAGAFQTPVIPRTDLQLDTERLAPAEAAKCIVHYLLSVHPH